MDLGGARAEDSRLARPSGARREHFVQRETGPEMAPFPLMVFVLTGQVLADPVYCPADPYHPMCPRGEGEQAMPLVNLKPVLLEAKSKGYAVAAFNPVDYASMKAMVAAAEELNAPVIIQTSAKTIKYYGHRALV